jgi:arylsulfatase A-like enzyme
MNKTITTLSTAMMLGALGCQNQPAATTQDPSSTPNVIIMLVDDAGYNDFGFMGSNEIKTPNIDQLASGGVVFTNAYVSATVCGPSRAGLITGRYQQRFGYECNPPAVFSGLDTSEITLGDAMQLAGYKTAAFGKWHLGYEHENHPNQRGFDYYWGFLSGSRRYFFNEQDDQPGNIRSIRENDTFTSFEGYLTDVLGNELVDYIDQNKEHPFFVYWSPNAPHTPMQATEEDMNRFKGHPRQTYAAMMWALDRSVGKITQKLEEENLLENTLIFFLSDNGGAHNNQSSNYPLKGWKGNKYEGGFRVPFFIRWPVGFQGGKQFNGLTSALDIFATCVDAANADTIQLNPLDGKSLLPYLTDEAEGDPHDQLFFRKDKMAATRKGDYKLIRVEDLGTRLYDLESNLSETRDLSQELPQVHDALLKDLQHWESKMSDPLWLEGERWNKVTWMIHEDLFNNQVIRVKEPSGLN